MAEENNKNLPPRAPGNQPQHSADSATSQAGVLSQAGLGGKIKSAVNAATLKFASEYRQKYDSLDRNNAVLQSRLGRVPGQPETVKTQPHIGSLEIASSSSTPLSGDQAGKKTAAVSPLPAQKLVSGPLGPVSVKDPLKQQPGVFGSKLGYKKPIIANSKDFSSKTRYDHLLPEQQKRDLSMFAQGSALSSHQKQLIEDARMKQMISEINRLVNFGLMQAAAAVWTSALPLFGLPVLAGAVFGDFLWALKRRLVVLVIRNVPSLLLPQFQGNQAQTAGSLENLADRVAGQINLSAMVKANILAMNLVVIGLIVTLFAMAFGLLYGACNNIVAVPFQQGTAFGDICKVVNSTGMANPMNGAINSIGTSINDGPYSLEKWNVKIAQHANANGIHPCILKTIIRKESASGNPNAIGHDNHSKSEDPGDPANVVTLGLNWKYSHGIGLTQWTIFPRTGSNRWIDEGTPSRYLYGKWYTIKDFLDPDTSLGLTARNVAANVRQGDILAAFGLYNGGGDWRQKPAAVKYASSSMELYNQCITRREF